MSDLRTAAVKYASFGWGVIRLHHVLEDGSCSCTNPACSSIGKHPLDPKGASLPEHDAEHVAHLWDETPNANIGIVAGTSSLLILDFDTTDALHKFTTQADTATLKLLKRSPSVKTGRGIHIYLEDPTGGYSPSVGKNGQSGVDIRAGVSYVVAPPSNHANGTTYTWRRYPTTPPEPPTPWLDAYIRERYDAPARIYEVGDQIIEGNRNEALTSIAGTMRRRGLTEQAIRAALIEENTLRCKPPLPTHEVEAIARSVGRYAPADVPLTNQRQDVATIAKELEERGEQARYTFLSEQEILNLPDIEYLVDGLLPIDGYGMVYGKRGSGKTFEMLHFALSIATGLKYRGRRVQQGGVAYIMSEGAAGLKKRLTAWKHHHEIAALDEFYALTTSVQLNDPELRAHLDLAIERIPADVKLLIIDTLARSVSGLDENSSADMTRFIGYVDEIRQRRGLAVVVVHHAGWNEGHERGSTVIGDAADWICKVSRDEEQVVVKTEKVKDDELPRPIRLDMVPIDGTGSIILQEADEEAVRDDLVDAIIRIVKHHKEITERELLTNLEERNVKTSQNTVKSRWEKTPGAFKHEHIERVDGVNDDNKQCKIWRIRPDELSTLKPFEPTYDTSFIDDEIAA